MSQPKIHFIYDAGKPHDAPFAEKLIANLGQSTLEQAEYVVAVGGDGMLLRALRAAPGKKVTGIVSPGSNSVGFWTNKGVEDAAGLLALLEQAQAYGIKPLRADIGFEDGSSVVRYGYNDISIKSVYQEASPELQGKFSLSEIDVAVQSALLSLRVSFARAALGPRSIMGGGLIFATSFGSTAMNRNNDGPSIDIRNEAIIMNGMGISDPVKGFNPIVNNADTVFDIEVQSLAKRPVLVTADSFGIVKNEAGSRVKNVRISTAASHATQLVLKEDPGIRAYSALMP